MLTARDAVEDRVPGLDAGADDYLVKPFSFAELLARLRALARRGRSSSPTCSRPATSDSTRRPHRAAAATPTSTLSAKEFALLEALHAAARARRGSLRAARGRVGQRVREPLERRRRLRALPAREDRPPFGVESIETVRGAGYRLRADGGRSGSIARAFSVLRLWLAGATSLRCPAQ